MHRCALLLPIALYAIACASDDSAPDGHAHDDHDHDQDSGEGDAATEEDASEPDAAMPGTCALLEQSGCDDDRKCAITNANGTFEAECVDEIGDVADGEVCERTSAGFGHDDCAPGLFCSFIGELGPDQGGVRRCHALCDADAQCPGDNRCAVLVDAQQTGFCGPSCEPFSDCGEDLTCGDMYSGEGGAFDLWIACRPMGELQTGDACANAYECPADHVCTDPTLGDTPVCVALCDDDHPCDAGTCMTLGALSFCAP